MPNALSRPVEAVVPARLGRSFRWLLASSLVNNAGDGVALAAGPLLVASLTRDPFLVSLATFMEYLPVLLFALIGGVAADRFDRLRMVIVADLGRVVVLAVLVAAIVTGAVHIWIVLGALFVMGAAETFADSASSTLLPSLVAKDDLGIANARMQGAFILTNQLLLPPVGAFLFAVSPAVPFATNAIAFVLGAALVSRVVVSVREERAPRTSVRHEMAEGIRWLLHHPPMRTLALTIFMFNITFGTTWGVMVLYAQERLGVGPVGFGLLTTAAAIGGAIGIVLYGPLERRFSLASIMRGGLLIETLTHLSFALTTAAGVALAIMVVFGAHEFIWGTTSTTVRQRAVPDEVLGRVGGVYRIAMVGGLLIGLPIGGLMASAFGITAPFWFAAGGSALLLASLWRELDHIAHAGDGVRNEPSGSMAVP